MITNKNIELLSEKFANNKLSHVFLIETNDKLKALEDVKELVKIINCPKQFSSQCVECNLCHLINDNIFPNLEIIYSDGQAIKKSQMEELKLNFQKCLFFLDLIRILLWMLKGLMLHQLILC